MAGRKNKSLQPELPQSADALQKLISDAKKNLNKSKEKDRQALKQQEAQAANNAERHFLQAEEDELNADPHAAEEEDQDDKPDGARVPQDESDEEAVLPFKAGKKRLIVDEEDTASPSAPKSQRLSRGDVHANKRFSARSPQIITSKLPPRRITTQRSRGSLVLSGSRPSSSLPPSSVPSSDHVSPPQATTSSQPQTPWHPCKDSSKPAMNQHTPGSQSLLKAAAKCFRVILATTDLAFAHEDDMVREVKAAWAKACQDGKEFECQQRFQADKNYQRHVCHIINQRIAQLRGDLVKDARALIFGRTDFGLSINLSADDLKANISYLLLKGRFGFRDIESRQGPFGNDLIVEIIGKHFFTGRLKEAVGLYAPAFNPVPLPLFALVLASIECALQDWREGTNNLEANKFEQDTYAPVYLRHLASLHDYQKKCPRACKKLQEDVWTMAWKYLGKTALPDLRSETYLEEGDFVPEVEEQEA